MSLPSIERLRELRAMPDGDVICESIRDDELLALLDCAITMRRLEAWLRVPDKIRALRRPTEEHRPGSDAGAATREKVAQGNDTVNAGSTPAQATTSFAEPGSATAAELVTEIERLHRAESKDGKP